MFFLRIPFFWAFFVFASFWPWEKDADKVRPSSLELPSEVEELRTVRVALSYEKSDVEIASTSPYQVRSYGKKELLRQGPNLPRTRLFQDKGGIRMGAEFYPVDGVEITNQGREIQVGNLTYHDAVQVLKNPAGSLTVVNKLDVEDYLKGVLPWEANPEWHEEYLKAQAVVSRTYALFEGLYKKEYPFSLSADVLSQVYAGKSIENSKSNRAVEKTHGEILTYNGKIFPAFFHSTCGGRTLSIEQVWKIEPHPSLKGVECHFCRGSKHFTWKAEVTASEIEKALAKKGHAVSGIQVLALEEIDASGRPGRIRIEHVDGELTLPTNEFRLAVGPDRIRSTRLKMAPSETGFVFFGRGWGHGAGMCQFGAKQLAELGYRYREILRYYYPASEVVDLDRRSTGSPSPEGASGSNPLRRAFEGLKSYVEDL